MFPVAICVAALVAHFAIDIVGDWALARDAYDAVSHDSRGLVALATLCVAVAAALRFVISALSPTGRAGRTSALARLISRSPRGFGVAVTAGALALLTGMETLDSLLATGRVEGVADAFGGSLVLGLGVAIPVALTVGAIAWRGLAWFAGARGRIAAVIAILFAPRIRARAAALCHDARFAPVISRERASQSHRAGKRGPPLLIDCLALP